MIQILPLLQRSNFDGLISWYILCLCAVNSTFVEDVTRGKKSRCETMWPSDPTAPHLHDDVVGAVVAPVDDVSSDGETTATR